LTALGAVAAVALVGVWATTAWPGVAPGQDPEASLGEGLVVTPPAAASPASRPPDDVDKSPSGDIGEEAAVAIALRHALVPADDPAVTASLRVRRDFENGLPVYTVKFGYAGYEYEYDIGVSDGAIVELDEDSDYIPALPAGDDTALVVISEETASQLALARVTGATAADLRIHLDYENGRAVWEGSIRWNNVQYEFEIDASSGVFREWEAESY
jgi:uncharacterized membrane protein YkoI